LRLRIAVPEEHVSPAVIDAALEAVTRLDESLLAAGRVLPFRDQQASRPVRWAPEPIGDEHFDHASTVIARGWGDCDDLAPWHTASLRASGEDPFARAIVVPTGDGNYHAIVRRSDGSIDDPSREAGMGSGRVSGHEQSLLACCPPLTTTGGPAFSVRPLRMHGAGTIGYIARCDLPWQSEPYALSSSAAAASPVAALVSAIAGAVDTADASGIAADVDRTKLAALSWLLRGMDPRDVCVELQHAGLDYEDACHVTDRMRAMLGNMRR
jgi:hypothetical protein